MRFKVETITPARARRMLDDSLKKNIPHRGISGAKVDQLVHAIQTDQWRVTHQGLALGPDGEVLDGNHRLTAIVVADIPVQMLVARDCDPADFGVFDTGRARTTADTLKIAGHVNVNHLSAIVRGFMAYKEVMGTTAAFGGRLRLVTNTDAKEFLEDPKNYEATIAALQTGRRVAGQLAKIGITSSLGIADLSYRLLPNELGQTTQHEFFERLGDGTMLASSSPILALRRWFQSDTGYDRVPGQYRREVTIASVIKSANDFALNKPRSINIFRVRVEAYPIPLPKGSRKRYEDQLAAQEAKAKEKSA